MSIAEVKRLSLAEKLQLMEALWNELRANPEEIPTPQWHKDLLDERRKAVDEGRDDLLDWNSVKESLPSKRRNP